ncbi:MAG TPA: hypothetical protein VHO48_08760 [Anaerolineaceae bacterium]|nr:hypothetical protein [Anaerolineaceae bacterium]
MLHFGLVSSIQLRGASSAFLACIARPFILRRTDENETKPDPIAETREAIADLQRDLNHLQEDLRLGSLRNEIEDIDTAANGAESRIRDLRGRGYPFEKSLEPCARDIQERWSHQRLLVLQQITQQSSLLDIESRSVETLVNQAAGRTGNPIAARPYIDQARSHLSTLEGKISGAEGSIRGMFDAFKKELDQLTTHLDRVDWSLKQVAEATFRLLPTEAVIMAVEAVWAKDGKEDKDDPKGVVYLTDQRLLFEQKQEVATKKVLFITTEKKKVQQLAFEAPVALLTNAVASKAGLFGHEDHIDLDFASGAPLPRVHFHLDGQDSNEWQALLGRARAHDFDADRAIAIDAAAVEKVKAVPAKCPACGGGINQVILRGQETVNCPYCGFVIRL